MIELKLIVMCFNFSMSYGIPLKKSFEKFMVLATQIMQSF